MGDSVVFFDEVYGVVPRGGNGNCGQRLAFWSIA